MEQVNITNKTMELAECASEWSFDEKIPVLVSGGCALYREGNNTEIPAPQHFCAGAVHE